MLKKPKHASAMTIPAAVIGSLVEYMDARLDAKAILLAIPHDELTAPLAALRRLMTTAKAFDGQWPMVNPEFVPDDYIQLVFVALPVIPKLQVNSVWCMEDQLRDCDLDVATVLAALTPKLTAMVFWYTDPFEKPPLRSFLPMCTRLVHVSVYERDIAAAVLPLLPPSVCELSLHGQEYGPDDLAALSRWLKTGRAKRLVLNQFNSETSAGAMAEMLATTASVTSVALIDSDGLIHALAAAQRPLWHFTDVKIDTDNDIDWAGILILLLDLSKLTRLVADALGDWSWFVSLLKMPLLQELALRSITLTVSRATLSDL
ncbi:hypothetical protein SPRG_20133 [Saprolegnia parasitica CBS 223.65]|uniref:F-box domain-containing protein n=1 Tax=Saprolegnia parasitica (strain CBS 223.65) TaxID=695850 RepID=A0A067CN88_SAPPC|nr:hypothetical protein SPRG_20133 [Saprolegnia parasitica CBS 223.65]KDO28262.1 hypothetical protein SPRG_20133 [Saprolegnia parasitica CBS 223.65]|eukprot:XP_012201148.1 hypothetical protein SPRG_20133 [Saprolegnia parasitica CBS 223.65]